ncbi:MAG: trehalose-6-phosphate synthase [candidate division WOR-3 bacterium]|jgi:trehalose 6-phosphate synthase/phosphatase
MRLLIVSNRLPITIEEVDGNLIVKKSVGGLGFPSSDFNNKQKEILSKKLFKEYNSLPVFLSKKLIDKFYYGFCNKVVWPLFHLFTNYVEWDEEFWKAYVEVNEIFAQE